MSVWHGGDRRPPRSTGQPTAPIAQRDAVYRALVAELGLSDGHRDHLTTARGLPGTALSLFASLPALSLLERTRLARTVAQHAGFPVAGVAGFYKDGSAWALVPLPRDADTGVVPASGFLVPVVDHRGRVQAMQLRADGVPPGGRRYTMLSSARWRAGACSGTPVAVWRPDRKAAGCWLTEGPLKGTIAAQRLDACVLATCGVSLWRPALDVLAGAPAGYPVTIAYDAPDLVTVLEVWRAREDLATALRDRGLAVRVATWDGAHAKGIDDALMAGVPVAVEPWRPAPSAPRAAS